MGVWASGSQFAGYDYVQASEPPNPEEGETWYDIEANRAGVYTGTQWAEMTVTDHGQLAGITDSAHHNPVSVEGPLRLSSGQVLDLAAADGLTLDADGQLRVASNAVTPSMLNFDPATQTELDSHTSDTTNPHNVSDDQTGAATALNNHAGDADAHHPQYTDSDAQNAVGDVSVTTADVEGSRSFNTQYTNNTGGPIFVHAVAEVSDTADTMQMDADVNGFRLSYFDDSISAGAGLIRRPMQFYVPAGDTYEVGVSVSGDSPSLAYWHEQQIGLS
ncbi:hypothetical protein ABSL23_02265 [Halobacterium sp. NMX12-1]|uniref:Uncharacterized protein n=1 Tax=Halobacterium sp. NMX12-1 TaxID=3166650 RepID=A0AAU8CEK4_9EURY